MASGDKVVSLDPRSGTTPSAQSQDQRLLQECRQRADKYLKETLQRVFDNVDDTLFSLANKGEGDAGDSVYFDAMREIRIQRQDITQAYFTAFETGYNAQLRTGTTSTSAPRNTEELGGLSLVDEQELEESLAIDGLVAKAKDRLHTELHPLSQRLDVLISKVRIDEDSNPYGPDVVCLAFRDAFARIELKVEVKLIIYKLFDQYVMKSLGDLYAELNLLLVDGGVLPQLKLARPKREAAEESKRASGADGQDEDESPSDASAEAGDSDVYQTLQRLLNSKKYGASGGAGGSEGGGGGGPAGTSGPAVSAADLLQSLSQLQRNTSPVVSDGEVSLAQIKDSLLQSIGEVRGSAIALNPMHDNTIDVIGMIFEFIVDEPSTPGQVKALLSQLQIPILKVAIADKEFFSRKLHPARRLLNVLGHAGIAWNERSESEQQRRFEKMEFVVNRVLSEFEDDPGIFSELLEEFTTFLAQEGEEVDAVEAGDEEATAEQEEQAAVTPSKQAFETIELRLEGAEIPEVLREFLRHIWRAVLQRTAESDGDDSEAWRRREQTVDDLMWSVEPKISGDDRRRMVAMLPRLLDALQQGMAFVACPQEDIDQAIEALREIHLLCLRGEKPAVKAVAPVREEELNASSQDVSDMIRSIQQGMSDPGPAGDAAAAASPEHDMLGEDMTSAPAGAPEEEEVEEVLMEDDYTDQARDMKLGTWLEFNIEDKARRGKLGWKSAVLAQYVFVDRKYKVVAEKTLATLAADLRQGRVTVVENVAMFDRALDAVLNGLMSGSGR